MPWDCCPVLSQLSVTLVYCSQRVVWIKMPLGMEVGLSPSHIVIEVDPAPTQQNGKGHSSPMSIVARQLPIPATPELVFQACCMHSFCQFISIKVTDFLKKAGSS